jgi:hypothetical protein
MTCFTMTDDESPSFDPKLAALFLANYREAARVDRNLRVSLKRTAHLLPLDGASLDALDDDGRERLDAFRVRYADLRDLLSGKVFRSLLLLEEEMPTAQLDVLNAMEKRAILSSFQEWKRLRDIRNAFMHDYPEHADERAEALTLAVGGAQELLAVLDRTKRYAADNIGVSAPGYP